MDSPGGTVSTVGSSNLDPLSMLLAREANIFVLDDAFGAELRGHLIDAIGHEGRRVEPGVYMKRTLRMRGLAWLAYAMIQFALYATGKRY